MISAKRYTRIVLSGGETKGLALLGALQHFWEKGAIAYDAVTHYAGASIGSLLALLLVCGYTPWEIWTEAYAVEALTSHARTNPFRAIPRGIGLMPIDGVAVIERTRELVEKRFGTIPTLRELYERTGKTLVLSVSNYTRNCVEYCSHAFTPELSCMEAVMESCSLPGIFQRRIRDGCTYVDGGFTDNFPLALVDDGASPLLGIATCAVGVGLARSNDDVIQYLLSVIALPVAANTRRAIRAAGANCDIFELAVESVSPFEFLANHERRRDLFVAGYDFVREIRASCVLAVAGVPGAPAVPPAPAAASDAAPALEGPAGAPGAAALPAPEPILPELAPFSF